jgi:hypothetical protein
MRYCEKSRNYLARLKLAYEGIVGKRYSVRRWQEIRQIVLSQCEGDLFSDEFAIALLHRANAIRLKSRLDLSKSSKHVANQVIAIAKAIDTDNQYDFFQNLLVRLEINPPRSTKYWFHKKIGGYNAFRELNSEQKIMLTYVALNWKLNKEGEDNVKFIKR